MTKDPSVWIAEDAAVVAAAEKHAASASAHGGR
jgi:hypothetical protein